METIAGFRRRSVIPKYFVQYNEKVLLEVYRSNEPNDWTDSTGKRAQWMMIESNGRTYWFWDLTQNPSEKTISNLS